MIGGIAAMMAKTISVTFLDHSVFLMKVNGQRILISDKKVSCYTCIKHDSVQQANIFDPPSVFGLYEVVSHRVVNTAILKVLQYYWQYFFEYCLHIANTFRDLVLLLVLQYFFLTLYCNTNGNTFHFFN